jgi:phage terminase large subunit
LSVPFVPTNKQRELLALLRNDIATNILAVGGSRSGKTRQLCEAIVYRARKYPGSRHLIVRQHFAHARISIFFETLHEVLKNYSIDHEVNRTDCVVRFKNGSEIWVDGFDDADRVEKILGREYVTIYFNEISQSPYSSILIGKTRLAQNISDCPCKAYYDCNPPSPLHWSYKLFIQKIEPRESKPLVKPELYDWIRMNPIDNAEHLPKDYISNNLETLPDREKRRFLLGEWVANSGIVYDEFDESMIIPVEKVPPIEDYAIGIDFGLNSVAELIGFSGENVYVIDEILLFNAPARVLNEEIRRRWTDKSYIAYCDPSGGERLQEILYSDEANNAVEPGIDCLRTLMHEKRFFVVDTVRGLIDGIASYCRDEKERIIKENDHECDATRYGIFTRLSNGGGGGAWV